MSVLREKIRQIEPVTRIGIFLLILSIVVGLIGYARLHQTFHLQNFLSDFYANLSTEMFSISITVIVIDQLSRRRDEQHSQRKTREQLILDAGSTSNEIAKNAIDQLRKRGWLEGATAALPGKDLGRAQLQGANLEGANLECTNLYLANLARANLFLSRLEQASLTASNLEQASLIGAKLKQADLRGANLQHAFLNRANLSGADMERADLQGANLDRAIFSEMTTLPDGSRWTFDADLSRFTDPDHPDFWQRN